MSEKEIAEKEVIPYLEKLGWPKQLITQYGRVPVQMGTEVKYADIVALLVDEDDIAFPYLVMEVKTDLKDVKGVIAQAESYSKFLNALIFGVTDGKEYIFYQMRPSGGHIRIANVPIPEKTHLSISGQTRIKPAFILCAEHYSQASERTNQYMELEGKIDDFFNLLAQDRYYMGRSHNYSLKRDITGHYLRTKAVKSILHGDIDSLKPEVFKMFFRDYIMCEKRPNIDKIFNEVDRSFGKVKLFLKFIKEFRGDPQGNLARLFDRNDELHILGMGPFVISQFLAGGHPMDYAVIEDRMVDTMKKFSLIDVKVRSGTPNGYLYISAMCRKLFNDVFKRKIEENKERLGFEIDEDFGLVVVHEFFWEYYEFDSYDVLSLEEASGEAREEEESMATENLEQIGLLTQD